ncbi:MAG TPA: hypothetical protein VEV84_05735, partial [Pyrinomonadaceae bacterium]|nr:hypothetical protein [Pyrinomonadaceae bacterium]
PKDADYAGGTKDNGDYDHGTRQPLYRLVLGGAEIAKSTACQQWPLGPHDFFTTVAAEIRTIEHYFDL